MPRYLQALWWIAVVYASAVVIGGIHHLWTDHLSKDATAWQLQVVTGLMFAMLPCVLLGWRRPRRGARFLFILGVWTFSLYATGGPTSDEMTSAVGFVAVPSFIIALLLLALSYERNRVRI